MYAVYYDTVGDDEWTPYTALVIEDDDGVRPYIDAMEPEDACFDRDLSWVMEELTNAYKQGYKDGSKR
jgi:hypothetical protein